jgi:hypothetical protein
MDHPFSQGLPDNCPPRPSLSWPSPSSSYRPLSSSYFSRPRHDPSGSRHPPTPPPALPGVPVPVPGPFPACFDPVRKITPPEEKGICIEDGKIVPREEGIHAKDEKLATANDYKLPYDKAYAYIQEFRAWRKGSAYYPLGDYEEPCAIKLSRQDWSKLSIELNLEESDR